MNVPLLVDFVLLLDTTDSAHTLAPTLDTDTSTTVSQVHTSTTTNALTPLITVLSLSTLDGVHTRELVPPWDMSAPTARDLVGFASTRSRVPANVLKLF